MKSCCFTGHRPKGLPWGENESAQQCLGVKAILAVELEQAWQEGFRQFWCGMAMGADLMFAEAVLACQSVHPEVELFAAIPCPTQTRGWPREQKERYERILNWIGPEHQVLVEPVWSRRCMLHRDEYMVERSSRIIAVYNGRSSGGTRYTLEYAMSRGLESIIIDPITMRVQR
jgi:uncharacterized phage-like protein YoqJ